MPNYTYEVPVSYTAEDNNSHINKVEIIIKDCSGFSNVNNDCDGYNFNKCPNDDNYCQPYIVGDIIYLQFPIDALTYGIDNIEAVIVDSNGNFTEYPNPITINIGQDSNRNTYASLTIDTSSPSFPDLECWYVKLLLNANEEEPDFFATEPYCVVRCEEETMLISGLYTGYDCEGNFYGAFSSGDTNTYIPQFRVRGVVEPTGYEIQETKNGVKKTKSKQRQQFLFRTLKVPYYVAKQIAVCFNSQQLTIDGTVYDGALKLNKNFDEGSEWIIEESIFIDCPEINFGCTS